MRDTSMGQWLGHAANVAKRLASTFMLARWLGWAETKMSRADDTGQATATAMRFDAHALVAHLTGHSAYVRLQTDRVEGGGSVRKWERERGEGAREGALFCKYTLGSVWCVHEVYREKKSCIHD